MVHTHTKIVALVVTLIFLATLAGFIGFLFLVNAHRADFTSAVTAAAELKMQEQSLSTLQKIVESSKSDRTELDSIILTDDGIIDLLTLIETIGGEQGVVLETSSLVVNPVNTLFDSLSVTVSVEGAYGSVMHVLSLLETLPYQSSVQKVFVQREGKDSQSWKGVIEVRVTKFKKI